MKVFLNRMGRRLAMPEAFGWPTLWIAGFVYFGTTVLFDARRFGGSILLWILLWAFGQVVLLAWALVLKILVIGKLKQKWSRVFATLLVGTTAGMARGFFLGISSTALGLANQPQWAFRIGGGAIAGFVLTVAGAALIGASIEHHAVVSRLTESQKLLLKSRKDAPKNLDKAREAITAQARATIGPRIEAIEAALSKAKLNDREFNEIANDIRALINGEVRPTVSSLAVRVEQTLSEEPAVPKPPKRYLGLPAKLNISLALSPLTSFGIALTLSLSTFAPLADPRTAAVSVLGAALIGVVLELLRRFLPNTLELSQVTATAVLALLGAVSTIPLSVMTQMSLSTEENLSALPIQSAFVMAALVVGLGFTKVVDNDRQVHEVELERFNDELAREKSWVEAQYWVIRREWAYLLHGRVQSTLTAAIARISAASTIDKTTLKLVKQDVGRARTAIQNGINAPFDLGSALKETVESWSGLCAVHLEIETKASSTIDKDKGIARAVNELVREAVSNAVRHGDAENVWVKIRETGKFLQFSAENDGKAVTKKTRNSLGTDMMNELTIEWSLRNTKSPNRVVLAAKLATATSSF